MVRLMVGVLALGFCACSSVKMVQRDNCWVRETKTFPFQHKEELGPCSRDEPKWAQDRLTRLVQECMAQADHRWQNLALASWNRGEPLPAQLSEQEVLTSCMNESATTVVAENEALKSRIGEVTTDRETLRIENEQNVQQLRADNDKNLQHLRDSHEQVASALGEAAKRPTPNAVATATSNGTATTQSDSKWASSDSRQETPAATQSPVAIWGACMPGTGGSGPVASTPARPSTSAKGTSPVKKSVASTSTDPRCDPVKEETGKETTPGSTPGVTKVAAPTAEADKAPAPPAQTPAP